MINKEKLKSFIQNYYLVIIFSIIVGLLSFSQQFLAINALGKSYNGVPLFNGANTDFYLTRVREVLEGHGFISSPTYFEYKNTYPTMLPVGEHLYALIGRVLGLSLGDILFLNQFLFPAFLFLLVYFLAVKLTDGQASVSGRFNAVAAGLLVVFGYEFTNLKFSWLVLSGKLSYMHGLLWNRPVNPIIGVLLMFALLLILWQMIEKKQRLWFLPAGIVIAFGVGYYFTLVISLSIAGTLMLLYLLKKEYKTAFNLFLTIIFSFVVSSPYWYLVIKAMMNSGGSVVGLYGGVFTRHLVFNKVLLAGASVFMFCLLREYLQKRKKGGKIDSWWFFCLAFFIGGFVAYNAQVITGIDIAHPHFVQFTIPLTMVSLMVLGFNLVQSRFYKVWQIIILLIFFTTLLFGVQTARSYTFGLKYSAEMQKLNEMFKWVNVNTEIDCVIFTAEEGDKIKVLVPVLSHCNSYSIPVANTTEAPPERNYHNFLSYLRINEVRPEEIENYLRAHPSLISLNFFKNWDELWSLTFRPWMEDPVKRVAKDYPEFYKKDFSVELKKYKIDYILSSKELSKPLLKLLPSVKLFHEDGGLYLYRF